jgi:hypothetical protein
MALTKPPNLLKSLQTTLPRGAPISHKDLATLGVSSALAHHYLKTGWLARLGRGVFMFPNDKLRQDDCLQFLARNIRGFHVGGKTALAWRGVRHNVAPREPLWLWGDDKVQLPTWFGQRFPARYTTRNPFASNLPAKAGLQPLPDAAHEVLVSVPERAIIELLSEVGIHQGIEEARHILEGVRALRMDVLATFIKHCRRIKAIRLCVLWAKELGLPWPPTARKAAGRKMGRSRWTARLNDGTTLILKA